MSENDTPPPNDFDQLREEMREARRRTFFTSIVAITAGVGAITLYWLLF